jgi:hypothetical protein
MLGGFASAAMCSQGPGVHCITAGREPHFTSLTELDLGWTALGASFANQLPVGQRDVGSFTTIQFRMAVNDSDIRNPVGAAQNLSVRVVSSTGTASVTVSDYTRVLYYPPAASGHKAVVMNTVRIPLSAFPGVNLGSVSSVDLVFDRSPSGGVLVSEMAFSRPSLSIDEIFLLGSPLFHH